METTTAGQQDHPGRASAAPTAHTEHHTEPSASPTARRRIVTEEPALSIKDLIKEFKPSRAFRAKYPERLTASGLYRAVNKVNLRVFPGEVVVLLGANGAGKTTTLACAQGLLKPTRGTVRLLGENPLQADPELRAKVGIMLQDGGLPNAMHPIPLLEHISTMYTDPYPVEELAERLGIDAFNGTTIRRLSGGQKQRLGIARALYRNPSVLILDEATSALDNETEHKITKTIERISKDITVIIVAHRLSTVRNVDQLVYLSKGQIANQGTFVEVQQANAEFANLVKLGQLPD